MSPFDQIANSIAPAYGHGQSSVYWLVLLVTAVTSVAGLLYGRRFFWIFAGLLGIVVGQYVSTLIVAPLPLLSSLLELAIAAVMGLIAAAAQRPVAFVLVFLGAGSATGEVAYWFTENNVVYWVFFVLAGMLGIMIMRIAYEETMIALTTFFSALLFTFLVREFVPRLQQWETTLLLALLIAAGATKQYVDLQRERRQPYILPASVGGSATGNPP